MKITTQATIPNNGMLCAKKGNQKVEFHKWGKGGVSVFLSSGVINEPEMEIIFEPNEIVRILEFLTGNEQK